MEEPIVTIEHGTAKVNGKEVPMITETTIHANGRQDVKLHLPALSTIATQQGESK